LEEEEKKRLEEEEKKRLEEEMKILDREVKLKVEEMIT